ncbi:MAG: DUF4430 domain-containing protein [Candidatus Helarchaeota archaeon]
MKKNHYDLLINNKNIILGIILFVYFSYYCFLFNPCINHAKNYYSLPYTPSYNIKSSNLSNITIIFLAAENPEVPIYSQTMNFSVSQLTVFDVMIDALNGTNNISYTNSTAGVFIKNIKINDKWYNMTTDRFWLYWVNCEFADRSCSKYYVSSNDIIIWYYSDGDPFDPCPNTEKTIDYSQLIIFVIIVIVIILTLAVIGLFLKKISNSSKEK